MMKNGLTSALFLVSLIMSSAMIVSTRAQDGDATQTFFFEKVEGLTVRVNATSELNPSQNAAIEICINCTSDDVTLNSLNLSIHGFKSGKDKISLGNFSVTEATQLVYHQTIEYNHTMAIPADVWGTTYAELSFEYANVGGTHEVERGFSMTLIRNVYLEDLERQFGDLNASHQQLISEYMQLNGTFAELNQTYWDLRQNYTSLQGVANALDDTRRVSVILVIVAVFFVATTIYLVMRRPKEQW
jgi:hypothetical protein